MALQLKDLFSYPIERYIPPVSIVGDTDEATVATELHEYVVTTPIERALAEFLEVYAESRTVTTDRIGVWISGFFGSGKSHFAKVLNYLLVDPVVDGCPARDIFLERMAESDRLAEVEGLLHRVGLLDSRVIMYNIKTEEDQRVQGESISAIMYRRYLASRGLSVDPAVAGLELSLIERGLYDAFRAEVERRVDRPWTEEREDFLFIRSSVAEALQTVAPESYHSREEALAALDMVDGNQRLTVSDLVQCLARYVDELAENGDPERPPRLVFIMDEMGQFIGADDQRLLELQSITEEFATQGRGRLWIVVTAQARLHELVGDVRALEEDFGRIGARFDTRLALTTEDVEKVLEGRVVKKAQDREPEIVAFYERYEGALAVLAALPGASRDLPPMAADRFVAATPFLPYHPPLIQAIFGNVQSATATGFALNPEARSMIGMAQGVLSNPDNGFVDGELGRVVSLDMVYDQVAVDLVPQDRREIEGLPEQLPGYRTLDGRVLKALYLLQVVSWIAVTADTLAHALLRDVRNENVGMLKSEVEGSLKRLHAARYVVPKGDGVWEFLTGTKKSFEDDAIGIQVRQAERRRVARARLGEVLRLIGKLNYRDGLRSFDVTVRADGEDLKTGGEIVLEVYSPLYTQLQEGFSLEDLEQIESFSHPETVYWVADECPELADHLVRAIRLDEVLDRWRTKASKTDEEREIIREKETELNVLWGRIETELRVALTNGTIVWNGRAEELDGRTTTLNPIFNRHLAQVVPYVYPKFDLAAVKPNEAEIAAVLKVDSYALPTVGAALDLFGQDGHLNQHSAVVVEVRGELERRTRRGQEMSGKALEDYFTGGDYGWHPVIVRLVLAAMFRAGMVSLKSENVQYTDPSVPAGQALLTQVRPFRRAVFIYEEEEAVTPEELRRAQDELKVIFDAPRREETANALAEQIREEMVQWDGRAERLVLQLRPARYPVPEALRESRDLRQRVTRFRNPGKVVKAFLANLEDVRAWHAQAQLLYGFVALDKRLPAYYRARQLVGLVDRACQVPDVADRLGEQARVQRDELAEMIRDGHVAEEWDRFYAVFASLQARFQGVYEALHTERTDAMEAARSELEAEELSTDVLNPYRCPGLRWAPDGLACGECQVTLHELPTHLVAVPSVTRRQFLREQKSPLKQKDADGRQVVRLALGAVLGGREIADTDSRDAALADLGKAIDDALQDGDVVTLEG